MKNKKNNKTPSDLDMWYVECKTDPNFKGKKVGKMNCCSCGNNKFVHTGLTGFEDDNVECVTCGERYHTAVVHLLEDEKPINSSNQ